MSDSRLRLRLRLIFNGTGRDRQRSSAHIFLFFFVLVCWLACCAVVASEPFFRGCQTSNRDNFRFCCCCIPCLGRSSHSRLFCHASSPHILTLIAAFRFDSHVLNETSRHNLTYLTNPNGPIPRRSTERCRDNQPLPPQLI